jgi:hypothetical protein
MAVSRMQEAPAPERIAACIACRIRELVAIKSELTALTVRSQKDSL